MPKSFRCRLVTPSAALVDDELVYASIPAWDGLMGVAPGRAPILLRLGSGELRLDFADSDKSKGGSRSFAIDGGFMRMQGESLTILAERAFAAETLRVSDIEAELKAIEGRTIGTGPDRESQLEKQRRDKKVAELKLSMAKSGKGI